jgi:uncharacterized membrane protein YraQ (UPF0718 family)
MLIFKRILGILILAMFSIFFIREIFVGEGWSTKISSIFVVIVAATALVNNIAAMKFGARENAEVEISLSKIIALLVVILALLLFPKLLLVESHWLFKLPFILVLIYLVIDLYLYLKKRKAREV